MKNFLAQRSIDPPTPDFINAENPADAISSILGLSFKVIFVVAGIWAFLQIVFAGYDMISSGGDQAKLTAARGKITWAIIGLVIIAAAWGLIVLVEQLLGIGLGFSRSVNLTIE
jgi:hypothetical protein